MHSKWYVLGEKIKLKRIVALIMIVGVFLLTHSVKAQAATGDGMHFVLNEDGESYCVASCDKTIVGNLEIPEAYNGKPVTAIGDRAFENCLCLTEVIMPDSIIKIGSFAFSGCRSLFRISLSSNLKTLCDDAYLGCGNLRMIVIPKGIANIGRDVFGECKHLQIYYDGSSDEWEEVKENNSTIDFVPKTMGAAVDVDLPAGQPVATSEGLSTQDIMEMAVFSIVVFVGLGLLMVFAFKVQRYRPRKLPFWEEVTMSTEEYNAYHRRREEERQKIIDRCNKAGVDVYDAETGERLTNPKEQTVGGNNDRSL